MKKGIRLLTLLVAFVLLVECSPIAALADDSHIITSEELTAAWALAGLDENAAPYHEGMDFNASMNASQMRQWLDELLGNEIAAVKHVHAEMENILSDMKREAPERYRMLTQGANDGSYQAMMQSYREAEELRQLLRYYSDQLETKASIIRQMKIWLTSDGYTASQQLSASREVEDAVATIREIRSEMAEHSGEWLQKVEEWNALLWGKASNSLNGQAGLDGWINDVRTWQQPSTLKTSVSASTLYPGGSKQSVMGRLNLVSSALADSSQTVDITVMNKDDIAFEIRSIEDEKPLENAAVTVTSQDGKVTKKGTANANGVVLLKANDFQPDENGDIDLSVEVSAENTQAYLGKGLTIQKGEQMRIYQSQDNGAVYLESVSFRGGTIFQDVLKNNYDALYSPNNDDMFDFEIITSAPAKVTLWYSKAGGGGEGISDKTTVKDGKNIATFTNTWKKIIKPGSTVSVQINDGPNIPLKLNMIRGVVDVPSQDFLGIFDTSLGAGISFKFPGNIKFFSNLTVNFSIPWEELLHDKLPIFPRMLLNLDGSYGLFDGGVPALDDKFNDLVSGWKSKDAKSLQTAMEGMEKSAKNTVEQIQNMMYPSLAGWVPRPFIMKTDLHLGVFFCLIARYKTDNGWRADAEDFQLSLRMQVGIIITFSMQFRKYVYIMPLISLFFGIDASLAAGFTLDVAIERQNGHTKWTWLESATGLTITLKIQITLGASFEGGIVSVTVAGYAYLRFVFVWTFSGPNKGVTFEGYAGMGIYLEIRILVLRIKLSYNFADIPALREKMVNGEWKLFPHDDNASARDTKPWFDSVLSVAKAEESTEKEEAGQSRRVEDYDALVPQAQPVLQNLAIEGNTLRYADINGQAYAFYISADKNRLTWVNMDTGKSGTFQDILTHLDGGSYPHLYDYDFDVQVMPIAQEWIDNSEYARAGNAAFYRGKEMVTVSLLCTTGFQTNSVEKDGETYEYQTPNDTRSYLFSCVHDPNGDSFIVDLPGYYDGPEYEGGPEITSDWWRIYRADSLDWTAKNTQLSCVRIDDIIQSGYGNYTDEQGGHMASALLDDGETNDSAAEHMIMFSIHSFYSVAWQVQGYYVEGSCIAENKFATYVPDPPSSGSQVRQVKNRDKLPASVAKHSDYENHSYYYLTDQGAQDGQWRLLRQDGRVRQAEIDQGDIVFYDVLWNRNPRSNADVFYLVRKLQPTAAETNGEEEQADAEVATFHLKTADEVFSDSSLTIRRTDLDVTVPTDNFSLQYMGDTVYVYWLELVSADKPTEQNTYRLRGLVFDPDTRVATDDFVLAQFSTANQEDTPVDMFLSADGMAYYTVKQGAAQNGNTTQATVYAYRHKLKAHADLRSFTSAEELVKAGTDVDMYITVTNDGSANINTIDLEVVLEDDEGNVIKGPDGKDQIIETLHVNLLNSKDNSRIVLGDAASEAHGESAIYRVEELPGVEIQDRVNIKEVTTYWKNYHGAPYSHQTSEPQVTSLEAKALLPGQTAGFVAAVHIPATWENLKHVTVRLAQNQNSLNGILEEGYGEDKERADHSAHDIDVTHRLYTGPRGEEYLHLTILNHAENGVPLKLYAEMYLDDDPTPIYVDLPYYPEHISTGMTHNLDMPLSALMNGRKANVANVTIRAVGVDDRLATNNDFTIYLPADYRDPLRIALQPADQAVLEGDTALFFVKVSGGREPYAYQWQEYMGRDLGWRNITGATGDTLTVPDVKKTMDGRQYRCVITDHGLDQVTSDPAALNIVSVLPPTGDPTNLPLYLALTAAALILAAALRYARKKREQRQE